MVLDRSFDFNLLAFELANVPHFFEIGWKYDHGERTRLRLFAEAEERGAFAAIFHVHHGSAHALIGAQMLAGVGERDAGWRKSIVRGAKCIQRKESSEQKNHTKKAHRG